MGVAKIVGVDLAQPCVARSSLDGLADVVGILVAPQLIGLTPAAGRILAIDKNWLGWKYQRVVLVDPAGILQP